MSEESANFYRIITLVVDVGTKLLCDILYHHSGITDRTDRAEVASWFHNRYTELEALKRDRALNNVQFDIVASSSPDPTKFDISLLTALLRNLCPGVDEPVRGWQVRPYDRDKSLGADILRIRNIRNEITAHCAQAQIATELFQVLWANIEEILIRMAKPLGIDKVTQVVKGISEVQYRSLDPQGAKEQRILELFKQWCKEEADRVLEKIVPSLRELHIKVDNVPRDVTDGVTERLVSRWNDELEGRIASQETLTEVQASIQSSQNTGTEVLNHIKMLHEQLKEVYTFLQNIPGYPVMIPHIMRSVSVHQTHQHGSIVSPPSSLVPQQPSSTAMRPVQADGAQLDQPDGCMNDRELEKICREEFGMNWESVAYNLDYKDIQIQQLKQAYTSPRERTLVMVKRWYDAVLQCGENPRRLLAAAFASIENNQSALNILKEDQLDDKIAFVRARPETIEKIQEIWFDVPSAMMLYPGYDAAMAGAAGCMFPPVYNSNHPQLMQNPNLMLMDQPPPTQGQARPSQRMVTAQEAQPNPEGYLAIGSTDFEYEQCRGEGMNVVDGSDKKGKSTTEEKNS